MGTLSQPAGQMADLEAELARLRDQVLEQGEMITDLARRLGAHERFRDLAETRAAPLSPYDQVTAWQARRRVMRAVRAEGAC